MENNETADQRLLWMVTACSFISAFIPHFVKLALHIATRETEMEINLRRQVCDMKAELGSINMVEEFAKYAKIQRKVGKVTDELVHQSQVRSTYIMKWNFVASAILYMIMSLLVLFLLWDYGHIPVVVLPEHWLYPIGPALAYPTSIPGGISLWAWLFFSGTTAKALASYLS